MTGPNIQMWQQPDGLWRWSYQESDTTLYSHMAYDTAQEARDSARTAYPDLEPPPLPEAQAPTAGTRRRNRLWLAILAVLVLYLLLRRGRSRREALA